MAGGSVLSGCPPAYLGNTLMEIPHNFGIVRAAGFSVRANNFWIWSSLAAALYLKPRFSTRV